MSRTARDPGWSIRRSSAASDEPRIARTFPLFVSGVSGKIFDRRISSHQEFLMSDARWGRLV
jgi:hypothetical protein